MQSTSAIFDTMSVRAQLAGVADQRGKIARMLHRGELFSLRRGLYASRRDLDPLCLANAIYGPSCISFETALAWHGMIPERVEEILSASPRRPKQFDNDFGRFRYLAVPRTVFPIGLCRVTDSDLPFLIASPARALADRIAREPGFRSMLDVARWLDGMRIEFSTPLSLEELTECAAHYSRPSVRWLLRYVEKRQLTAP